MGGENVLDSDMIMKASCMPVQNVDVREYISVSLTSHSTL